MNEQKIKRPYTEKRKASNRKWDSQNYDRMSFTMKKGEKQIVAEHAAKIGESVNVFLRRAVLEQIERDNTSALNDDSQ